MYKFYATLILLLLIWSTILFPAQAQDRLAAEAMVNQLEELDLEDLETFLRQLDRDLSADLPGLEISKIYENLKSGQLSLDLISILQNLATFFFKELMANSSLLGKLIILAIIAGILQNIQAAFEEGTTGKMAYAVTYLALISIALASFSLAITIGKMLCSKYYFIQSLLPSHHPDGCCGGSPRWPCCIPLSLRRFLSTLTLNDYSLIYFHSFSHCQPYFDNL